MFKCCCFWFFVLFQNKSSHRRCSVRKGLLRNFAKFTGKQLCQILFFNKVAGLRSATLLKKRLWHWCFPANFAKFLRIPFLQNTSRRLLLLKNEKRSGFDDSDCISIQDDQIYKNVKARSFFRFQGDS